MKHIVIGLFDSYADAEGARNTLVRTGFAQADIELQANPESTPGETATSGGGAGVLANIERFLANLFASGPRTAQAERYRDAVQRGAVLVCVNAASEAHAELASRLLTKLGATDVGERAPGWEAALADPDIGREHSVLDELGIGGMVGISRTSAVAPSARSPSTNDAAAVSVIAAGAAPGSGAVLRPDLHDSEPAVRSAVPSSPPVTATPDEFMEYEEDFRSHYDEQYASENARYEDYVPAYRYGATLARDARFHDRSWDELEFEAQHDWETNGTPTATDEPGETWDRVKAAVRHGWERVTGHHHV
ncbi:hypothetical protein BWP39_27285 [Paraburkholderia acidicola]|uniref:Uncharacterized protein n=1 Tax=Paraburkholderia acidicola TaxID=1912599 RepID=A0A2A4ESV9_9BURK|nr:hypothetical protein [Paraburkholderia acidicola]PCE23384.1 hypothetical protein BWP39_27285 [Paraburkholderia acidicola]